MQEASLPSTGQIVKCELATAVIVILSAVVTLILAIVGIFSVVLVVLTRDKALNAWKAIPDLWLPLIYHYRFFWWTIKDGRRQAVAKKRQLSLPRRRFGETVYYYEPGFDVGDLVAGMVMAFDFGYLGFVLVLMIAACLPAVVVVKSINTKVEPVMIKPFKAPEHRPSEIQAQERQWGPWLSALEAGGLRTKANVNNLALIADTGEVRYSAKFTVDVQDGAWQKSLDPKIIAMEVKGDAVVFKDDRRNSLCLNVGQPFMFENMQQVLFVFSHDGLMSTDANVVKQKTLAETALTAAPNPKLSR